MAGRDASFTGSGDKLSNRIRARARNMTPSLARVAVFIDGNRPEVMTKSALEIAAMAGTSDATVIRAVQALGFSGLPELKDALAASMGGGETAADNMARTFAGLGDDLDTAVDRVFEDHQEGFSALTSHATRAQIAAAVRVLGAARAIGVFGIGPSAYLAGYFGLQLSRSGRRVWLFDGRGATLPDQLLNMEAAEAVVIMAYGPRYTEALTTLAEARRLKVPIVLITDSADKKLASGARVVVTVHRGHAGRVALHGATFVCLEAMALALAAGERRLAMATLEKLNELRGSIGRTPERRR